ncbi:MAG: hypothetical protein JO111_07730 [Caulobacteraceae bacterium]|nr:hypothetical protein [Caulobacteraceae bacterium]
MKPTTGLIAVIGAFLAACHGNFYGGGDVGYVGQSPSMTAAATPTTSTARPTTSGRFTPARS